MTHNEMIIDYLKKFGSITPAEAYEKLGIMRLQARIHELRQMGYNIVTELIRQRNRYGKIIAFAKYKLV